MGANRMPVAEMKTTGEKSIARGEHLGGIRIQILHRSHTGEDHGRLQQGINPAKASNEMVAENAKKERNPNHGTGKKEGAEKAMIESSPGVALNLAWCRHSLHSGGPT